MESSRECKREKNVSRKGGVSKEQHQKISGVFVTVADFIHR
jgi:hypothetical protein